MLVDARTPEAFAGWAVNGDKNGGHLEGAVNISAQWIDLGTGAATDGITGGTGKLDPSGEWYYWSHDSEKKTLDDAIQMEIDDNGIAKNDNIVVYDTNGKDAAKVAAYLKGKGYSNVTTANKSAEINADGAKLVSYKNYQLNVPAEVVKSISDNKVNGTALSDAAKAIVGERNIKILHAEYCAAGRYSGGYHYENPIDWTQSSGYYKKGHVPGAEPISTDDFEPETDREDLLQYRTEFTTAGMVVKELFSNRVTGSVIITGSATTDLSAIQNCSVWLINTVSTRMTL